MPDRRGDCTPKCPRLHYDLVSPRILGSGPAPADLMIVGRDPGQNEDKRGQVFIGRAGQFIDQIFTRVGIDRNKVYITNAVKCATPGEDKEPGRREIQSCKKYLAAEIEEIRPNVVVAFGNAAMEALLGQSGVKRLQNQVLYSEEYRVKVVPVVHPAYILRNPGDLAFFQTGLRIALRESGSRGMVGPARSKTRYFLARTADDAVRFLETALAQPEVAVDLETSDLNWLRADILCVSLSWKSNCGWLIPWKLVEENKAVRVALESFARSTVTKAGHNLKFDIHHLKAKGVDLTGPYRDTILEHSLIDENSEQGLDVLVLRYTDMGEYWARLDRFKKEYCREHKIKLADFSYSYVPPNILYPYAVKDADATFRLLRLFENILVDENQDEFYRKYTLPLMPILSEMEYRGIRVDREKLYTLIETGRSDLWHLQVDIENCPEVTKYEKWRTKRNRTKELPKLKETYETAKTLKSRYATFKEYALVRLAKQKSHKFNMASPAQLKELFFEVLGLKPVKVTKKTGAASTDKEVLDILGNEQDVQIAKLIDKHRKLAKYVATYLEAVYEQSELDGRIHTNYIQHDIRTGRLSSRAPNLQNLPKSAIEFKSCLVADPGYTFIKADLAQAEFRVWASCSNDRGMIEAIESGFDVHSATAEEVFGIPRDSVSKEEWKVIRNRAKSCVTGNTWIPTVSGLKRINNIGIGEQVLDQYNEPQNILELFSKVDNVYEVATDSGTIRCTRDHPFFVLDSRGELVTRELALLDVGDPILCCTPYAAMEPARIINHPVNEAVGRKREPFYEIKINSIDYVGRHPVYDFVTTGDKVMIANGFFTLDCVFGMSYGMGPKTMARRNKITIEQAENILASFSRRYAVAARWMEEQIAFAHKHKYVKSWMGRKRRLPQIDSEDKNVMEGAERQARNSPIQAAASDMNNYYMVRTIRAARKHGMDVFPAMTTHDENVIMVRKGQEKKLVHLMQRVVATSFPEFRCRMELEFKVGDTIGTAEELKLDAQSQKK